MHPVPGKQLVDRLLNIHGRYGLPRLAFLASCETAHPDAEVAGAMGGLGHRLVRDLGVPAVVAMTDLITICTATELSKAFYQFLLNDGIVDLALVKAYAGLAGRGDIAVPVPTYIGRLGGRPLFLDETLDHDLTFEEIAEDETFQRFFEEHTRSWKATDGG